LEENINVLKKFGKEDKGIKLSNNFCVGDFWADPSLEYIHLDTDLALIWEEFYKHFGKKPRLRNVYNGDGTSRYAPVKSAGYRVSAGGGAGGSQHLYGRAVDFEIPGVPAYELAKFAERLKLVGGIGLYHNSGERKVCEHIHIDTRGNRARWGWRGLYSNSGRLVGFGGIPVVFKDRSQGAGVECVQEFLVKNGYKISVDGEFGAKTKAALMDWQSKHGLKPDGAYGKLTNAVAKVFSW
jgi:peptidoglycan hydrolase-like protein with peptidoglycan-binding domain